jgi:hypothetical protein
MQFHLVQANHQALDKKDQAPSVDAWVELAVEAD